MRRNADNPALPIYIDTPLCGAGLSKREHIAALVLAGLASRLGGDSADFVAKKALDLTDALLARLGQPWLARDADTSHAGNGEPPF